ncbi:MaoC family dehydratase N-terminal domain-containing protein [Kitasatospora sp. NPDC001309]|uniref:FAS1-like dehydratase domain-containing protein n=1 Tax=Kitasatospora sp. NPDC001309 TaxID=3364013 RepID=UPI0036CFD750
MTLNRDFIGRTRTAPEVYEVSREKIREFALATGDPDPAHLDPAAARALGHPDVIAPPAFATVVWFRLGGWPLFEPGFGKQKQPVMVLGGQRVTHHRPIRAGDRLVHTTTVADISDAGPHERFTCVHRITTVDGEPVSTVTDTALSRGTAEAGR